MIRLVKINKIRVERERRILVILKDQALKKAVIYVDKDQDQRVITYQDLSHLLVIRI
jgi:hypothetical protein